LEGVLPGSYPFMMKIPETLSSVESLAQVDPPARALQQQVRRMLPEGPVYRALAGSWIGHPVHPLVVLVPIGSWVSAGILDLMPRQQQAARRLVLAGLVAAAPAVAAGLAEYRELDERGRRVGLVHALANLTASVCYTVSYGLRRRGRTGAGKAAAMLGLAAVSAGGALGGHLTYAQGAGVFRWQARRYVEEHPPETAPRVGVSAGAHGPG
jgi:uncharacterized membrane protein